MKKSNCVVLKNKLVSDAYMSINLNIVQDSGDLEITSN